MSKTAFLNHQRSRSSQSLMKRINREEPQWLWYSIKPPAASVNMLGIKKYHFQTAHSLDPWGYLRFSFCSSLVLVWDLVFSLDVRTCSSHECVHSERERQKAVSPGILHFPDLDPAFLSSPLWLRPCGGFWKQGNNLAVTKVHPSNRRKE